MDNNNFSNQKGTVDPTTGTYSYSRAADPNPSAENVSASGTGANTSSTYSSTYTNANTYANNANANGNYYSAGNSNAYANYYSNPQQNTYDKKAAKVAAKEAKRQRKAAKKAAKKGSFGSFAGKAVAAALIFGIVGGGVFTGVSYGGYKLLGLGTSKSQTSTATEEKKSTEKATSDVDLTSGTVEQVDTSALAATSVSDIVDAVMPSIVAITNYSTTTYTGMWGQSVSQDSQSCGSGIIVGQDETYLYIATNNHVVSGAETLSVQFSDDTTVSATVKGTYEAKDLAVVEVAISDIEADTLNTIKIAEIGDSSALSVGDTAIAIGNALGYGQSVTTGVISATGRSVTTQDETTGSTVTIDNLIQTDAAINPGNSGGALINAAGQVIGINSAKYSSTDVEGFGFSIPMEDAWSIIEQLITREKVDASQSAYLGIQGQDISSSVASAYNMPEGIYVYAVVSGSAAEQAGIQAYDVVTAFDGQTVYTMEALKELMTYYASGQSVVVTVQRYDSSSQSYVEHEITVTLQSANAASSN